MQRNILDLNERLPDNTQVRLLFEGHPFCVLRRQEATRKNIINALMQEYKKRTDSPLSSAQEAWKAVERTLSEEMFSPARRYMQPSLVKEDKQSLQADRISIDINFPPDKIVVFEYGFTLKGEHNLTQYPDTVETIYELSPDKKSWHLQSMQTTDEVVQQFKSTRNRVIGYGVLGALFSVGGVASVASVPFLLAILTPAVVFPVLLPLALILIIAGPLLGALAQDMAKNNRKPLLESLPPPPPAPPTSSSYDQIRRQSGIKPQPSQTQTSTLPSAPSLPSEEKPAQPGSPVASENYRPQSPRKPGA